ncbi:uncharacterized protein LOC144447115 [Glandiceps talaboti]
MRRAWFDVAISTADVFAFEVGIEVDLFRLGMREIKVVVNFKDIVASIAKVAWEIIKEMAKFLIPSKKKRSIEEDLQDYISEDYNPSYVDDNMVDDENKTIVIDSLEQEFMKANNKSALTEDERNQLRITLFEENCKIFTQLSDFLGLAMERLYDVALESRNSRDNASSVIDAINEMTGNITNTNFNTSDINMTEAYVNYNLTEEEIEIEVSNINVTDNPVINETLAAIQASKEASLEEMAISADFQVLGPWRESMENVTRDWFDRDKCVSFYDCVIVSFSELHDLYEYVDIPHVDTMQGLIKNARDLFIAVLWNDTLRIDDAIDVTSVVLQALQDTKDLKIFCATVPKIIRHPSNKTVLKDDDLTLVCEASGDPKPDYFWYKDGQVILLNGMESNELRLTNVNSKDRGWFQCKAGNHVVNVTSQEVFVDVHEVPKVLHDLEHKVVLEGAEHWLNFVCNVTGWPKPIITWHFSPNMVAFRNKTKGPLKLFMNKPRPEDSGWYKCIASNNVGYAISNVAQLTVLRIAVAVPIQQVLFGFYKSIVPTIETNEDDSTVFTDIDQSIPDKVQQSLAKLLFVSSERIQVKESNISVKSDDVKGKVRVIVKGYNYTDETVGSRAKRHSSYKLAEDDLDNLILILLDASYKEKVLFEMNDIVTTITSGTFENEGRGARCPDGFGIDEIEFFICGECKLGHHQNRKGMTDVCQPCPIGSYQPEIGKTSCQLCPSGHTTLTTGASDIESCVEVLDVTTPPLEQTEVPADKVTKEGSVLSAWHYAVISVSLVVATGFLTAIVWCIKRRSKRRFIKQLEITSTASINLAELTNEGRDGIDNVYCEHDAVNKEI